MTQIIKELSRESTWGLVKSFCTGARSGSCSDNTNYRSGLIIARDYKKGRTKDSKLRKTIARVGTMGLLLLPPVLIISWTSESCASFLGWIVESAVDFLRGLCLSLENCRVRRSLFKRFEFLKGIFIKKNFETQFFLLYNLLPIECYVSSVANRMMHVLGI